MDEQMIITNRGQVSAEWLTTTLRKSKALTHGSVDNISVTAMESNWASNLRISVTYSADARGTLPDKLFLKMTSTDARDGEYFGDSEVQYYLRDYVDVEDAPLVRCFDGAYANSAETHRYHLLLDDLADTHIEALQKKPTFEHAIAIADAFATLHARWWGADRIADYGVTMHSPAHIQRFVDISEPGAAHILRAHRERPVTPDGTKIEFELEPHWPDLIQETFSKHPAALKSRTSDANGFTIIHGDPNYTNILVPRDGDRPLYLIDKQPFDWSLTTWLGVYDLIYVMLFDWDVETRRKWEIPILQRYHAGLIERGVSDYSWEALLRDYRLCIPIGIYIATEYCRGGIHVRLFGRWLSILKRTLTACDDHNCSALW